MKQQNLFKSKVINEFGGSLLKGRRKSARPLGIKQSNHLVLKAKNPWLLLKNTKRVSKILKKYAAKFGIQIYSLAVHSDHIHICFRTQNRVAYKKWIRSVTSVLVQKIAGLKFGLRPWSRVVQWGRAFKQVMAYIRFNKIEADFLEEALTVVHNWEVRVNADLNNMGGV